MTVWRKGTGWASTLAGVLLVWGTLTGLQVREANAEVRTPVPVVDCDSGCKNRDKDACPTTTDACSGSKTGCETSTCGKDETVDPPVCKCSS